jgi:hypothetical protein
LFKIEKVWSIIVGIKIKPIPPTSTAQTTIGSHTLVVTLFKKEGKDPT